MTKKLCRLCGQRTTGQPKKERTIRALITECRCPSCGKVSPDLQRRSILALAKTHATAGEIARRLQCSVDRVLTVLMESR